MVVTLLLAALCFLVPTGSVLGHTTHISYSVVPDIFQQDDSATNASSFNFTASNFGLIDRAYPSDDSCPDIENVTQWQRLAHHISTLKKQAKHYEHYKLVFMGRHGEGYHNVAESYFGTPAWNCYWAELNGNQTASWADARLTVTGQQQALYVNAFWKHLIQDEKITTPQRYYTSPLYRCLQTAMLSFSDLDLPHHSPFVPIIKELLREGISAHTCDHRSDKTYLQKNFPGFKFENGFADEDPYWKALYTEPQANQDVRSKAVLDDIFRRDRSTYISFTSHSGEIGSLLRVLGHRPFSLSTGSAIPVLIKAVTQKGNNPATTTLPLTPQPTCAKPPTIRDSSCNDCSCCL